MNEELKAMQRSMNLLKAQVSFMKDGFNKMYSTVEQLSIDLDAFVEVYSHTQQKTEDRLDRIEKHVGL